MAARLDILLQRNEDWARSWLVRDGTGQPVDLTGFTVEMQAKRRLDNAATVASGVCTVGNPGGGQFTTILRASEGHVLSTFGNALQVSNLPYDIRLVDSDGYKTVLVSGVIILTRGVTRD